MLDESNRNYVVGLCRLVSLRQTDHVSIFSAFTQIVVPLYILNGLGPNFCDIASLNRAYKTSLKFEEFYDLLVGYESYYQMP